MGLPRNGYDQDEVLIAWVCCVCGLAELQGVVGHDLDSCKEKLPGTVFMFWQVERRDYSEVVSMIEEVSWLSGHVQNSRKKMLP